MFAESYKLASLIGIGYIAGHESIANEMSARCVPSLYIQTRKTRLSAIGSFLTVVLLIRRMTAGTPSKP